MPSEIYSDLSPDSPEQSSLLLGVDAVIFSVRNLFSTDKDERVFNLDYTAYIDDSLFEDLDLGIAIEMYTKIASALERKEPRVILIENESYVEVNEQENGYNIVLSIDIRGYENSGILYRAFVSRTSV